jgi:hypothetical protein
VNGLKFWLSLGIACGAAFAQAACGDAETETNATGAGGTTTTMPSTGGMGAGGMGTGGTPIVCGSAYTTIPATGPCDLLQQDCPPGNGCVPVSDGAGDYTTTCVPGAGLKEAGQDCASNGECKPGLECIFNQFCSPVCCPDQNNEPCGAGICNVTLELGPHTTYYCSYLSTCDLFDPMQCDNGADGNCYVFLGMGYAVCAPGGGTADGENCGSLNDCETNSVCYQGACHYGCLIDNFMNLTPGEGGCPAATPTCSDVGSGITNIGVCI